MKSLATSSPVKPSDFSSNGVSLGRSATSLHDVYNSQAQAWTQTIEGASVLIGVPDDRGIVLNGGHAGAEQGPTSFRNSFYKLYDVTLRGVSEKTHKALSYVDTTNAATSQNAGSKWFDAGDIRLEDSIEATHERLADLVNELLREGVRRIYVVGGGHDFSYGSYKGHALATEGVLPIVNFDAHFDLRPVEDGRISSGTPFRRVVENFSDRIANGKALLELGIQRERNPASLMAYCFEHSIPVIEFMGLLGLWRNARDAKETSCLNHLMDHLDNCRSLGWKRNYGRLHLSVDLDVFSSEIAPGTSASTPWGVSLAQVGPSLSYLSRLSECRVVDIAELCPPRDNLLQTSRLAASLVFQMFLLREESVPHE